MGHVAHRRAMCEQLGARRDDVGHDEIQCLNRAWHGRGDSLAEVDRARRAGRRELDYPKLITPDEVGVKPPAQAAVEAFGAIDVRYRNDDDLELHFLSTTHVDFLRSRMMPKSDQMHGGELMTRWYRSIRWY
jgi:hypothetical protein